MFLALLLSALTIGGYFIYRECTKNEDHFKERGIPFDKPQFLWGNCAELFKRKLNMFDFTRKIYGLHPDERVVGLFALRKPTLLIRDPDLIKQLVVKEFDNLMGHGAVIDEEMDDLMGSSLISLNGQKWKDMRSTLSPVFTGSKMRMMFQLIVEVCEQMMTHLEERVGGSDPELLNLEVKDLAGKFTNDIIALCAFGLKCDTMKDKDNEFYSLGQQVMDFKSRGKSLKFLGFQIFPKILKFFKVQIVETPLKDFFRGIVLNTMQYRMENNVHRPDVISLLMEARKEGKWTDDELIAQCFIFFLAGFDTSSTAVSFAIYQVATNPEVQERLIEEIRGVQRELQGTKLTYEVIQEMKYLDAVVSEVLRIMPPVAFTDRVCTKEFTFDDQKGFKYHFREGDSIWIPMFGLHMDEKYFKDADQFNPDRFMPENRHLINPDTYMPFGVGQRNCIASRFALMEVKAFLFHFLANFSIQATEKTQIPLKIVPSMGSVDTEHGIHIGIRKREASE